MNTARMRARRTPVRPAAPVGLDGGSGFEAVVGGQGEELDVVGPRGDALEDRAGLVVAGAERRSSPRR